MSRPRGRHRRHTTISKNAVRVRCRRPYRLRIGTWANLFHGTRLQDETDQALLDFIRTDLDVCLTFANVAETAYSMGHREHAERTLASAEKGYSDMLRFFSQVEESNAGSRK